MFCLYRYYMFCLYRYYMFCLYRYYMFCLYRYYMFCLYRYYMFCLYRYYMFCLYRYYKFCLYRYYMYQLSTCVYWVLFIQVLHVSVIYLCILSFVYTGITCISYLPVYTEFCLYRYYMYQLSTCVYWVLFIQVLHVSVIYLCILSFVYTGITCISYLPVYTEFCLYRYYMYQLSTCVYWVLFIQVLHVSVIYLCILSFVYTGITCISYLHVYTYLWALKMVPSWSISV